MLEGGSNGCRVGTVGLSFDSSVGRNICNLAYCEASRSSDFKDILAQEDWVGIDILHMGSPHEIVSAFTAQEI